MASNTIWGIDLGGTKIECVVLDKSNPSKILHRQRIDTEQKHGYHHILNRISSLVDMVVKQIGKRPDRIGIGTPGSYDSTAGILKNSNTTCLNGQPFYDDLQASLKMDMAIANDANCFALAEAKMGIVQEIDPGASVVFGVILGTGVGGGLVVDGKVVNGRHGIAGEWGHNFLDTSGGPCYCGKSGCVERILSGPSLERYYHSITGRKEKLKNIYKFYKDKSDPAAQETIDRLVQYFGYAISWIVNILDPDVIVLGGGVGNIEELYTKGAEAARPFIFNPDFHTVFAKPKLGDSAGVFGAALLAI